MKIRLQSKKYVTALLVMVALFIIGSFKAQAKNGSLPVGGRGTPPAITGLETIYEDSDQQSKVSSSRIWNARNAVPVSTGAHYKYLSDEEKIVYEGIYRAIVTKSYVPYALRNEYSEYDVPDQYWYCIYEGTGPLMDVYGDNTFDITLMRVMEALYFDHPDKIEYYMCYPLYYRSAYSGSKCYTYVTMVAMYDDNQFASLDNGITNALNAKVNSIKNAGLVDTTWDAVTELKVYDYYVKLMDYDYKCVEDTTDTGYFNLSHTAYGSLCRNLAVCDGYSAGFHLILDKLGIKTMIIGGDAYTQTGSGGHAWNIIMLDGSWYEVDSTWGEDDSDENVVCHDFFNRTTAEYESGIEGLKHLRQSTRPFAGFRMPRAYGTHYTYEYINSGHLAPDSSYVPLQGISLDNQNYVVKIGEKVTLQPIFTPSNATIKDYDIICSNDNILDVNGNTLIGNEAGVVTVTVISYDGSHSASCTVTVKQPSQSTGSVIDDASGSKAKYVVNSQDDYTVTYKKPSNKKVKTVTIPSTVTDENGAVYIVTEVSSGAFKGLKKLKKVVIPETVTKIGKGAFKDCGNLKTIKIKGGNLTKIGSGAFKNLHKDVKITVYAKSKKLFNSISKKIRKAGAKNATIKWKKSK